MGGRHLDATRPKVLFNMVVSDDRNLATDKRKIQGLSHQVGITLVGGIHGHRRVTQHRFGARGGHF